MVIKNKKKLVVYEDEYIVYLLLTSSYIISLYCNLEVEGGL